MLIWKQLLLVQVRMQLSDDVVAQGTAQPRPRMGEEDVRDGRRLFGYCSPITILAESSPWDIHSEGRVRSSATRSRAVAQPLAECHMEMISYERGCFSTTWASPDVAQS
ncbi:hypothetical protein [Ktedonobacter racemifer]|uniref:hypothetical protein n=1 Tax=Ktedonobacter racemifer TaxID=363277 RepID=UPI0012F95138|nr:hypothetical protein [Ktedonobacter racemifer]